MRMSEEDLGQIIEALNALKEDITVPRNIKQKLENVVNVLSQKGQDLSLRINKALNELDEMSDDNNIQSYTRTQLWNVASMLESI